jgi:S1-C subfamily serine protease
MSKLIGFGPDQVPTNSMLGDLAFAEASNIVSNDDIGTNPNQIPLNLMLGSMAFQNSDAVTIGQLNVNTVNNQNKASVFPYQVITGQKRITASATYFDLFVCGHTNMLNIYLAAFIGTGFNNGGRMETKTLATVYGAGGSSIQQHAYTYNNGLNATDIAIQYVNSGTPSYKIQGAVTYTATADVSNLTLYYVATGISSIKMYGL